jgi:peroxiredoxin Q/BCP
MKPALLGLLLLLPPTSLQDPVKPTTTMPAIGKPAPAFRLNNHEGRAVDIPGKTGSWTVLAFYPKAATPG